MAEFKSKYNKKKCATCIYRGTHGASGLGVKYYCNFSDAGKSATIRIGKDVIDTRGGDFNNCLLYEKGAQRKGKV